MKWIRLVVTTILFVSSTDAQTEWDFSGYIVDLPIYQRNNDTFSAFPGIEKNQFFNLTRTRLRPTLYIGDNSRINLEYEFQAVYFSSPLNLFTPSGDKTSRQIVDLTWLGKSGDNFVNIIAGLQDGRKEDRGHAAEYSQKGDGNEICGVGQGVGKPGGSPSR